MGLVGRLTQCTPEDLERVRRDPELLSGVENAMTEADASSTCDLDKAWHGVHFLLVGDAGPEERSWVLPLYLAVSAGTFIASAMIARLIALSGGAPGFFHLLLSVIGAFSAIAFILSGALWLKFSGVRRLRWAFSRRRVSEHAFVPPDAIRKVMLGGTLLTDSECSVYYATPEEVRALAPMLAALSDDEIRRRFDAARMRTLSIYIFGLAGHADASSFEYALENLHRAVACYQDAARRGNAVVLSVS